MHQCYKTLKGVLLQHAWEDFRWWVATLIGDLKYMDTRNFFEYKNFMGIVLNMQKDRLVGQAICGYVILCSSVMLF